MNIAFRVRRRLPLLAKNYSALSLPRRSESSSVSRRVFSLQVGVVFVFHGESLPRKRLLLIRFLVLRLLLHGESVPAQCQAPTNACVSPCICVYVCVCAGLCVCVPARVCVRWHTRKHKTMHACLKTQRSDNNKSIKYSMGRPSKPRPRHATLTKCNNKL